MINYAKQSNLTPLDETLILNQENQTATFIHNSCRTELRNLSRRKRPPDEDEKSNKRLCLRSENERFDFKKQCFHCNCTCMVDTKHSDRNKFEEVRNETFENIFEMYANFLQFLQINTVVFDGYSLSTKDPTDKKRSGKASATIKTKETNLCATDRNTFLSNYENKKAFVKCLAATLRILGFQVFECPCDADTTIAKVALGYSKEQPVIVYADDTDILSLLLHNYYNAPDLKDICLTKMTGKSGHQQRKCYSTREVISRLLKRGEPTLPYLLFAHAFTDCDTTSSIYRFGETSIFKNLENSKRLRNIANIFYKDGQNPQAIGTVAISFFEALHSSSLSLPEIPKKKYDCMTMESLSNIDPSVLPP